MADATAGKLGIGEQSKPTETSAEDSITKESVNPTTDVENGPNIENAPDSNVSDIATEDVKSKAESIDSPINSLEEESNMSAIEDDSVLSDQAIQNGVTPPPIENVHADAEPEDTDSAMEGSNFDAAGGAPIAESTAEDASVQQPPVDPELEAQQQEEQRSAVDAAGISQEASPANTPSEDEGPVEAAESEGDDAAGIVDQALSVPLQSNGDDIEANADNIVENAEEDQLLGDRDADDVDEELDEEGLLDDQEQADGPATQEAAQPPTPEDPPVEQELSVSQEDVPSTINEEQCGNDGLQGDELVSKEDASDTSEEIGQQKNETVSPEDASQSPLGSGQEAASQKDDSPSSPTNLEMAEPVNQDDTPPTILKDNQSPNVEHVNPEEAAPTSEDDGASQQDAPSNAESASVQEMSQHEEIASQQENPPETCTELTSTQISAPPSKDAPDSTGEDQPSEKTDDISPESKEDSPMSVTTSPAAEPMEMEPATSTEGDEPMEVDRGDAKIANEEKMDIDPAGSDDISASQNSAMKEVQASDKKEDTPMPNAAENKETNAQEREKNDINQESATQDTNSAEGDSLIKISKVETVVEGSPTSQIEIKIEHCETETESVEEGTGLRITAVSGATETSASEKQEAKGEKEKNVESSSGTKIKEEISEKTGEDLKGYAADTVNEYLNMMGMENLDEKEKQNLNVTEPVSKESPATKTKLEAKPSSKPAGPSAKAPHACLVCGKLGKCKYNIVRNGDTKHLCEDKCFKMFRVSPGAYLKATTPSEADGAKSTGASSDRPQFSKQPIKSCSICKRHEISSDKFLSWQGMDYCSEDCLDKFMTSMSATCSLCNLIISEYGKGKYCIKVGSVVKPFCSSKCMGEFSKTLKVCSYCQKDLKICKDSFIAPVGLKGKEEFKDFCSQACLKSLEDRVKGKDDKKKGDDIEIIAAKDGTSAGGRVTRSKTGSIPLKCTVCGKIAQIKHEVNFEDKIHQLCSDPCFAAFRYANKLTMNTCDNCGVYCNNEGASPMFIQFEGQQRRFCSNLCVSIFKTNQTKVATCTWCKNTKTNFDMIERVDSKNKYQLFCSLNCLSLYRVNLQASSNQRVVCDHCKKYYPAQYHLTMSDASVRNFCCYPCVMAYQSQFQSPQRIPVTPAATQQKAPPPPRIPPTNQGHNAQVHPVRLDTVGLAPIVKLEKLCDMEFEQVESSLCLGNTRKVDVTSRDEARKGGLVNRLKTKRAKVSATSSKTRQIPTLTERKMENVSKSVRNTSKVNKTERTASEHTGLAKSQADNLHGRAVRAKGKDKTTIKNSERLKDLAKELKVTSLQPVIYLTQCNNLFESQKLHRLRKNVRLPQKERHTQSEYSKTGAFKQNQRTSMLAKEKCSRKSVIELKNDNRGKSEKSVIETIKGNNVPKSRSTRMQNRNLLPPLKSSLCSKSRSQKREVLNRMRKMMQPVVVLQKCVSRVDLKNPQKRKRAVRGVLSNDTLSGKTDGKGKKMKANVVKLESKKSDSLDGGTLRKGHPGNQKENVQGKKLRISGQKSGQKEKAGISEAKLVSGRRQPQKTEFHDSIVKSVPKKHSMENRVLSTEKSTPSAKNGDFSDEDDDFNGFDEISEEEDVNTNSGMITKIIEKLSGESDFCPLECDVEDIVENDNLESGEDANALSNNNKPFIRRSKRNKSIGATVTPSGLGSVPIISNVMSLAPQQNAASPKSRTTKQTSRGTQPPSQNYSPTVAIKSPPQQTPSPTQQVIRKVIIQPPPPKAVKNKSLLCRPLTQTKATSCRPHVTSVGVQTDKDKEPKSTLIPIPVPIYIPVPMAMYTYPTPYPLPIPVPIPVPCFIPTTKKSADSILKQIKEIQERMPADPFEAELLMMAEAVASAEGKEDSDSDSDKEDSEVNKPGGDSVIPAVPDVTVPSQDAFGEDMLQMALRMATEMTDQPMDLEASLEPVPVHQGTAPEFSTIDPDVIHSPIPTRSRSKGRGRGRRGRGSKRVKVEETPPEPPPPPAPIPDQPPPPDADMHLKYTYGVNAWKHWVIQKNVQLEKVATKGSKLKHFKTDLLQMTADELNFSLCLFVKEVRKPNGEEYAPDSIFYLCLGIQQYLFENGRIDNIFTDFYYEKFTECLHEVVNKYQPRLNSAGLLVCRIEEEHLWESKQLGAHSPYVLLNTLVYFNTKYFMLKTPAEHLKLSFSHIMKHWKKSNVPSSKTPGRSVYLRYYAPVLANQKAEPGQKRKRDEVPVFEQGENIDNPLRCPVKLYEFYLSKCPESIKSRSDLFYLIPERSCVPDSPVWYSTLQLQIEALNKMLARVMMVREVQEAHMTVQPIYV